MLAVHPAPASMWRPALLGLLMLLSGCVATTQALDVSDAASRQAVSERAGRQRVRVVLRNQPPATAAALRIDADSTSWSDPATQTIRTVSNRDVVHVSFAGADRQPAWKPATGFAVGAAVGGVVGGTIGYTTYEPGGWGNPGRTGMTLIIGSTLGLLTGGAAALVSVVPRGGPERFVFVPADSAAVR